MGVDRGAGARDQTDAVAALRPRVTSQDSGQSALFSLEGRVALVTGASRGIGAAIAAALARAGADVAAHGNMTATDATCEQVRASGCKALSLVANMADPAAPDRLVRETVDGLGGLDIVVNNAGTIRRGPTVDTSDEDWSAVIEVNLFGVFRLCRAAGRHMRTARRGERSSTSPRCCHFKAG